MATNVMSGARAIFKVNSKVVAFASGVDGSEEIMYEPADVLDSLETAENVPVGYRVTFNCAVFRTVAGTKATGPVSTQGPKAPAAGQVGSLSNPDVGVFLRDAGTPNEILTNGTLSATITDRLTGTTLYRFEEVKPVSRNFSIAARGIVQQNVAFNAIRMLDESSPV
jgi:hypothetical protein